MMEKDAKIYVAGHRGMVALEVGYKDPNYFNRAFKKRHNMTPEEFRKRVG